MSRQVPTRTGRFDPSQEFMRCVAMVLEKANFATAETVIDCFRSHFKPMPENLESFKKMDEIKYFRDLIGEVNAAIDGYYYASPAKLIFDCEDFVLKKVNSWLKNYKKQPEVQSFGDLGMGEFLYNPYLFAKFGYKIEDIPTIPRVKIDDIVDVYLNILATATATSQHPVRSAIGCHTARIEMKIPNTKKGILFGTGGSNIRLIEESTATSLKLDSKTSILQILGSEESVAKAFELVKNLLAHGASAIKMVFEERFEQQLCRVLQTKFDVKTIRSLGVVIEARKLHLFLVDYTREFSQLYSQLASKYSKDLQNTISEKWGNWLRKQVEKLLKPTDFKASLEESSLRRLKAINDAIPVTVSSERDAFIALARCESNVHLDLFFKNDMSDNDLWALLDSKEKNYPPIVMKSDQFDDILDNGLLLLKPFLTTLAIVGDPMTCQSEPYAGPFDIQWWNSCAKLIRCYDTFSEKLRSDVESFIVDLSRHVIFEPVVGPVRDCFQLPSPGLQRQAIKSLLETEEIVITVKNSSLQFSKKGATNNVKVVPIQTFNFLPLDIFECDTGDQVTETTVEAFLKNAKPKLDSLVHYKSLLFVFHNNSASDVLILDSRIMSLVRTWCGTDQDHFELPYKSTKIFVGLVGSNSNGKLMEFFPDLGSSARLELVSRRKLSGMLFPFMAHQVRTKIISCSVSWSTTSSVSTPQSFSWTRAGFGVIGIH
jgi:hypothetical protein